MGQETDHDMLIGIRGDVKHIKGDVGEIRKDVKRHESEIAEHETEITVLQNRPTNGKTLKWTLGLFVLILTVFFGLQKAFGSAPPTPSWWTRVGTTYIKAKVDSTCVIDGTDTSWTTAHRIMIGSQHSDSTAATTYTVDTLIANTAVTLLDATAWRMFFSNATTTAIQELAFGVSGKVLKSNGASAAPTWETDATGSGAWEEIDDTKDTARWIAPNADTALVVTSDGSGNSRLTVGKESDNTATTLHIFGDTLTLGGDAISEFAGTGLTVTSNELTVDLGTAIVTGDITDGTILEADLNVTNAPTGLDNYVLSLNEGSNNFTWVAGGAGLTYFTEADDNDTSVFTATGPNTTIGFSDHVTMQGNSLLGVGLISAAGNITLDDNDVHSPTMRWTDEDEYFFSIGKYTDDGTARLYNNEGAIRFEPNADVNDYLKISTTSNIITLETVASGDGDLVIKSGGGDISFHDDLVTMKAWKWYTGGDAGGTYDSTDAPADGDQLTWSTGGGIDWQAAGGGAGEANTLVDTGTFNNSEGFGLAQTKAGVELRIRGLIEGSNVTIAASGDTAYTITAAGGSGAWEEIDDTEDTVRWIDPAGDTSLVVMSDGVGNVLLTVGKEADNDPQTLRAKLDTIDISGDVLADFAGNNLSVGSGVLNVGVLDTTTTTINHTQWDEHIKDNVGDMVTGNTETGIAVTHDDADNTLDFAVDVKVSDSTAGDVDTTGTDINAALEGRVSSAVMTQYGVVFAAGADTVLSTGTWTNGYFLVGRGADYPLLTAMSGDGSLNSSGALAIAAQAIVCDDVDSTAENFVFDGAYHVTSATEDSAYITIQKLEDTAALRLLKAGDEMSGNLTFSGAQTVDGVDISALNTDVAADSADWNAAADKFDTNYTQITLATVLGAVDIGGATSLEIPAVDDPTTDAEGEIAWDANDDAIEVYMGDETESALIPAYQKLDALIFAPDGVNDEICIFHVDALLYPFGIEIDQVSIQLAADAAYSMVIEEWSTADPPVYEATISTVTTGASDTYAEEAAEAGAVDADDRIYLDIPATDVDWVHVQIIYHVVAGN